MPELEKFVEHDTGAYAIVNLVNGKLYVGGAYKSFKQRFMLHKSLLRANRHYNIYLQRAWNKHGEASFEFRVLERCQDINCQEVEQKWLDSTNSCAPAIGYNMHPTAGSPLGYKHSDMTKAVMSHGQKTRFESEEQRAKNGHNKGKLLPVDWCKAISEGMKKRFESAEERASVASKGTANGRAKMTDETVREARHLRIENPKLWTFCKLAKRFGVSSQVMQRIISGESWSHIT